MDLYTKGYKWALDSLAEGKSIEYIEARADGSIHHNDFDRGAMKALSDYIRTKTEEVYDDPAV